MGFGGPVWHASVASQRLFIPDTEKRRIAFDLLEGYGDASLGEWEELGKGFFHLRRRLSDEEAELVGPVVDVRGTEEAGRRVWAVRKWVLMVGAEDMAAEEVAGV